MQKFWILAEILNVNTQKKFTCKQVDTNNASLVKFDRTILNCNYVFLTFLSIF
jgi:hypothetical protein